MAICTKLPALQGVRWSWQRCYASVLSARLRSKAGIASQLVLALLAGSCGLCALRRDDLLLAVLAAELPPVVFGALALLALLGAAVARSWFAAAAALGSVVIAAVPLGGWNVPSGAARSAPYRVLTCNVEQWSHDGAVLGRMFSELAPDVFCLQEAVSYDDIPGDPEWTAFSAALPGYQLLRYGEIAIGTRWHVLDQQLVPLHEGPDTRPLLDVTLQPRTGIPIHVISTHLAYTRYYGELPGALVKAARGRHAQVLRLLEHAARLDGPVIVCGDFNAAPNSVALALLRERFADAWQLRGQGFGFTSPSDWPWRRIDYLLVRAIDVGDVQVLEQPLSDYRAVSADSGWRPPMSLIEHRRGGWARMIGKSCGPCLQGFVAVTESVLGCPPRAGFRRTHRAAIAFEASE